MGAPEGGVVAEFAALVGELINGAQLVSVVVTADQKILLGGSVMVMGRAGNSDNPIRMALLRLTGAGASDVTSGTSGLQVLETRGDSETLVAMAQRLGADGKPDGR